MTLPSGTKLGPYEIDAPIGAGGMGEVYRARDTRLDRSVAVKILPAHLAEQAGAGERFEREARTISSLNHPNICQLHDVGEQTGVRYLVMELLEGETLADRLRRGSIPLDQALRYGSEIAQGLDAAHRRGVVHRDLKPGNIMLTKSGAKLMDFGLAKAIASNPISAELTATMTSPNPTPLTQQGTIVGTFQYMAPEQVEGKEADARSDVFSLGAVLYEMASGKRAFEGKTLVSVAAAILEKEPETLKTLQPTTPAPLERAIRKCLAKDPEARWQSAGDLASELKWIGEAGRISQIAGAPAAPDYGKRTFLPWAAAAVACLAAIALGILYFGSHEAKPVVRTQIAASDKMQFAFVGDQGGPPVISPDGKQIVFAAKVDGKTQLYIRSLSTLTPQPLPATQDAIWPFWSPDGKSIAFFTRDNKLKRIDAAGGPAVVICDATNARGGTWGTDGTILFEPFPTMPLYRVPSSGGTPVELTHFSEKYTTHRWPQFMPDGKHFIYLAANHAEPTGPDTAIFWASLDGKESKLVVHTHSSAAFAAGYLLYVRDSSLIAQPFNPSSGELKGDATVLNDDVQVDGVVWRGSFTASESGQLIYQPASVGAGLRLTWFDRAGKEVGALSSAESFDQKTVGSPPGVQVYNSVQLSHDGKKAAVTIGNPKSVIWIYDVEHSTRARYTFGNGGAHSPQWSHDGKQIAYMTSGETEGSRLHIVVKSSDGSGEVTDLLTTDFTPGEIEQALWDWSPDGRYLLYGAGHSGKGNGWDIWALPMFGDHKPFPYVSGPGDQHFAKFSPDGRWVAYASSETGQPEVYVAPFPWTGSKWQISNGGGIGPLWRNDGKEIVFQALGSPFHWSAQVDGHGSSFSVGDVRTLFESDSLSPNTAAAQYSITPDAQRFLEITTGDAGKLPLTVVQNWTEELKK